jgi:hypothetical protein
MKRPVFEFNSVTYVSLILIFYKCTTACVGARWRSWLRHCATNRKIAGSFTDGAIRIFH